MILLGFCHLLALPFFLFTSREILGGGVEEKRENSDQYIRIFRIPGIKTRS